MGQLPSKPSRQSLLFTAMSASDALAAVRMLYDVASKVKHISLVKCNLTSTVSTKVKDNKSELLRLSRRIEHIVVTLDESRSRDIIRSDEYNDVLSAIFEYGSPGRSFKNVCYTLFLIVSLPALRGLLSDC